MDDGARETKAEAVALADALASASVSYNFPGAEHYRIVAVCFTVATDGNAGNRTVVVSLEDGSGALVASIAAPFTLAASKTSAFTFGHGLQQYGANDAPQIGGPFVGGRLPGNLRLVITVDNAKAGDVIEDVRLLVEQRPAT